MSVAAPRYSMSLPPKPDIPYSPHRPSTALPKLGSSLRRTASTTSEAQMPYTNPTIGRSSSLLNVAGNLSRWPARRSSLLPSLDPDLSAFNFTATEEESASEGGPSPRPSFAVDLEVEEEELIKAVESDSWYETSRPKGRMAGVRKEHRLAPAVFPAWTGYGQAAQDWDALFTADTLDGESPETSIPRRVLDLGCGVGAHWCCSMIQKPGWENTQFVGIDMAPIDVSISVLPYEQSTRLSFLQHNMLEGLPFDDDRFDHVHCSQLALSGPEHKIADLCAEVYRVLTPGGNFSITEIQFDLVLPPPPPSQPELADLFLPIKKGFDSLLEERFINPSPLSILPAGLAMHFDGMSAGRAETIELPGWELDVEEKLSKEELRSRVWLHQYAQLIEGCAPTIARSAIPPPADSSSALDDDASLPTSITPHSRQLAEFISLVSTYSSELLSLASLPHLISTSLDWAPSFDLETARQLSENIIPGYTSQLEDNEAMAKELRGAGGPNEWGEETGDEWEKEELVQIELVRQQLGFRKREAEAELREVKSRLGMGEKDRRERKPMGAIKIGRWRARKN
ncbi:hypothetical protein BCR35DRAFT_335655 [Leucosporidium creatinivorum]|uniref:Methyltransferase domain-containing protein n=1 Tax=Leucosporidium creatinivorum TaxID=106004 RepID=A0A1Y2D799_9BASI|nr:hypothetical protein BCR35DRAFT_335655 [Leucosporidium creatinivorum]